MNEEEILDAIDKIKNLYLHNTQGYSYSAIQGLLDLYNKTKNQLEEKTYLYNKLETESKYLIEKQRKEIERLSKVSVMYDELLCGKNNEIDKQQEEIETLKEVDKKICNEELLEKDYVLKNYISKDKIREFIKEELPDNEIMECCNSYDINGIYIREKLEKLLQEGGK